MARMARVVIPGLPHHVTQRGNRRQQTFFCDKDYSDYIRLMATACRQTGTRVWAYCLMPNHVHLVMVPTSEDGLRGAVANAHRRYSHMINQRFGWRGHLWQERFFSNPMDESYLRSTVRYVEMNSVAAGLCDVTSAWQWSSARAHLMRRNDDLVDVAPMLGRVDDWQSFIATPVEPDTAKTISAHLRTGRPLGHKAFVQSLEELTERPLQPAKRGPKPRLGS
ncbi:MAG: putative transposase [Gammaproteobacteria bacterium]|jgi:putative transposase